mmetsp:Transcript_15072/g.64559  ORF Transcript_15072/g.64559 Transcript_15072/m.64559 type:complete len:207 (+) Transcript_15072:1351-1971(+)
MRVRRREMSRRRRRLTKMCFFLHPIRSFPRIPHHLHSPPRSAPREQVPVQAVQAGVVVRAPPRPRGAAVLMLVQPARVLLPVGRRRVTRYVRRHVLAARAGSAARAERRGGVEPGVADDESEHDPHEQHGVVGHGDEHQQVPGGTLRAVQQERLRLERHGNQRRIPAGGYGVQARRVLRFRAPSTRGGEALHGDARGDCGEERGEQ